jgi:hypothetical protein
MRLRVPTDVLQELQFLSTIAIGRAQGIIVLGTKSVRFRVDSRES